MDKATERALIKSILVSVKNEYDDEEVIHLLLDEKLAANTVAQVKNKYTFGQIAADKLAKFVGSWFFITIFVITMVIWIGINVYMLSKPFDPYPFILLNLALSCLASIQAPLIMMSQNRQEEKDRERAENDYKVNLKTEFIIQDLHDKIDLVIKEQHRIIGLIEKQANKKVEDK